MYSIFKAPSAACGFSLALWSLTDFLLLLSVMPQAVFFCAHPFPKFTHAVYGLSRDVTADRVGGVVRLWRMGSILFVLCDRPNHCKPADSARHRVARRERFTPQRPDLVQDDAS